MALVLGFASLALLFMFTVAVGHMSEPAAFWIRLSGLLVIGMIPFVALGLAIGYLASPSAAAPIANLISLPAVVCLRSVLCRFACSRTVFSASRLFSRRTTSRNSVGPCCPLATGPGTPSISHGSQRTRSRSWRSPSSRIGGTRGKHLARPATRDGGRHSTGVHCPPTSLRSFRRSRESVTVWRRQRVGTRRRRDAGSGCQPDSQDAVRREDARVVAIDIPQRHGRSWETSVAPPRRLGVRQ